MTVIGTFLPWLRSGRATRNSYATDGTVRRLLDVSGAEEAALRAWPFVSLACAVAVALLLLGLVRWGAVIGALAAAAAGSVAGWALAADDRGLIRPDPVGPTVTLAGTLVTLLAVLACLAPRQRKIRRA